MFILSPILDTMIALYEKPRSVERFHEYLRILQGDSKDDMVVPVGNFNPMGKEHVPEKLQELKRLDAEAVMNEVLSVLSMNTGKESNRQFKVFIAVADDLKGAWTNHYTTDYDNKFRLNALIARNFCTPLFWTSETYSEELIRQRTLEQCIRTLYWLHAPKPKTLAEHIGQEKFVAQKSAGGKKPACDLEFLRAFYEQHKDSEQYDLIFNFLYGDEACRELAFPTHGVKEPYAGYRYAIALAD
jgi:hypothetical protein